VVCLVDGDCTSRGANLICVNHTCQQDGGGACRGDADCGPGAPKCLAGTCVGCIVDEDCGLRQACNDQLVCVADLCRGLNCGNQGVCDPRTGRCSPGCAADGDCAAGQKCDPLYGICYNGDGTCDDLISPCRPGLNCGTSVLGGAPYCQCPVMACGPQEDGTVLTCPEPAICNEWFKTCSFDTLCHPGQFCMIMMGGCIGFN
jgi:hypothetical protein